MGRIGANPDDPVPPPSPLPPKKPAPKNPSHSSKPNDAKGHKHQGSSGSAGVISALPEDLNQAATAFLDLSNTCTYLTDTWIIQGGGGGEFASMDPDGTNKPELDAAWESTLHEIAGILLSGQLAFADAAADLFMVAKNFHTADQ